MRVQDQSGREGGSLGRPGVAVGLTVQAGFRSGWMPRRMPTKKCSGSATRRVQGKHSGLLSKANVSAQAPSPLRMMLSSVPRLHTFAGPAMQSVCTQTTLLQHVTRSPQSASSLHEGEQPSPLPVLQSSQCSPCSTAQFPQRLVAAPWLERPRSGSALLRGSSASSSPHAQAINPIRGKNPEPRREPCRSRSQENHES